MKQEEAEQRYYEAKGRVQGAMEVAEEYTYDKYLMVTPTLLAAEATLALAAAVLAAGTGSHCPEESAAERELAALKLEHERFGDKPQ